jgi:hypothetical protein
MCEEEEEDKKSRNQQQLVKYNIVPEEYHRLCAVSGTVSRLPTQIQQSGQICVVNYQICPVVTVK